MTKHVRLLPLLALGCGDDGPSAADTTVAGASESSDGAGSTAPPGTSGGDDGDASTAGGSESADGSGSSGADASTSTTTGIDHDQTNCEPDPEACGYPGPNTTGVPAGTDLTVHDGDLEITEEGAVIDGLDIKGCVIVHAPGVTLRNSKVSCDFATSVGTVGDAEAEGAEPLLVEDVEIACSETANVTGIGSVNVIARRVHAHGCENGYSIDRDVTIEDSYVPGVIEVNGGHGDAIQFAEPAAGIVIRRNTLFAHDGTAAVNWTGPTESVVVEDNFVAGGAYTVYCPRESIDAGAFSVIGNRFGTYTFGPTDSCGGGDVTFTDNFWDSDLSPVDATNDG